MFKLVGKETFSVGKSETKATINIDAVSGFAYEYTLEINGKSLKKYMENRSKVTSTWVLNLDGTDCRVVLGEPVCICTLFTCCTVTCRILQIIWAVFFSQIDSFKYALLWL